MSGGKDTGKVCRNAGNGRVCFCSRAGADAGRIVFKVPTFDLVIESTPFTWTCIAFNLTHDIDWLAKPVVTNGARFSSVRKDYGDTRVNHVFAVDLEPNLEYALDVDGSTGCASDQDPLTTSTVVAKFCGEEIYRAEGLVLYPRSQKFTVKFTTDENADVTGCEVTQGTLKAG